MCTDIRNKVGPIPLLFAIYYILELLCGYISMYVFVHYCPPLLRRVTVVEDIMSRTKAGEKKSVANPLWIFTTKPSYIHHTLKTCV